ncbi:hypothetical protein [Paenibacillus hubeiensis]|uniref:hypothetical protein n=1 Tax=Paenibacillus hubeiensis TaxID=3077330 RepID=UPI0031BBC008
MNKSRFNINALGVLILGSTLLVSGCGAINNKESVQEHAYPQSKKPIEQAGPNSVPNAAAKNKNPEAVEEGRLSAEANDSEGVGSLMSIELHQTDELAKHKRFEFTVRQVPEGYTLSELRWTSNQITVIDNYGQAVQHAKSGKEGFYIDEKRQISGFRYTGEMKGESGKVTLVYTDGQGSDEVRVETEVALPL